MKCTDTLDDTIYGVTDRQKSWRLKAHADPCRRPHTDYGTRKKSDSLGKLMDTVCYIENKVVRISVLSQFSVYIRLYPDLRSSRYLVGGYDPGTYRSKTVEALSQIPLFMTGLKISGTDIIQNGQKYVSK
jgi:hypothetical protein